MYLFYDMTEVSVLLKNKRRIELTNYRRHLIRRYCHYH